jgi:hypothetical protein
MLLVLILSFILIDISFTSGSVKANTDEGDESRTGDELELCGLAYSTYIGMDDLDLGRLIAYTPDGDTIICGYTESEEFYTTPGAAFTEHAGRRDVFVGRFDISNEFVFSTFIGGNGDDTPNDIIVDDEGDIHITGSTSSDDWPVTVGANQSTRSGGYDTFVCELSADGSELLHSTYLGGSQNDDGGTIGFGINGSIIIGGSTNSEDYPVTEPITMLNAGGHDIALICLSRDYSTILSSRYIGGNDIDWVRDMFIGFDGAIYISGDTNSLDLVDENVYLPNGNTRSNAFLLMLDADGQTIRHSTVIGGSGNDFSTGLVSSDDEGCYLIVTASSDDFPIIGGGAGILSNPGDVVICKMGASGAVEYSTTVGGTGFDSNRAVVSYGKGNLLLTGYTASNDFPTSEGAIQDELKGGSWDTFLLVFNLTRREIMYSTYLGGSRDESPFEVLVDDSGLVTIVGSTTSEDFPVTEDALQTELNGTERDVFFSRIGTDRIPPTIDYEHQYDEFPGGSNLLLFANATDNIGVQGFFIIYRYGSDESVNDSLNGSYVIWDLPRFPEGDLFIRFSAVDYAGNWNSTEEYSITLVNVAPIIPDLPEWDVLEGTDATYRLSFIIDHNGDSVTIECSDPTVKVDQVNMRLEVRHDVHVPDRIVTVTVSDGELEATTELSIHVINVNDLPVITEVLPANGTEIWEGEKVTLSVTAEDEEGDDLTVTWKDGEEVLGNGSPLEVKLKPGERVINVVVSDGTDQVDESIVVIVKKEEESPGPSLVVALAAVVVASLVAMRRRR